MQITKQAIDLTDLAVGIIVLGIVVSIGANILIQIRDSNGLYANTTPYNLSNQAAIGLSEYGNWFKILVIVGVATVVLSLIFMAFGRSGSMGGSY